MTSILFTTDTELSPGFHARGLAPLENLRLNVFGEVGGGEWGLRHQLRRLTEHGLRGVFFVEALCGYAVGEDVLKRVVAPILESGHEVQLHVHTEWLPHAKRELSDGLRGSNLCDFDLSMQTRLLECALDMLRRAGASCVSAFRAGNYGANPDTLTALSAVGIKYDSSYNRMFLGRTCSLEALGTLESPLATHGLVEVPITHFVDGTGRYRHLQLCAVSSGEMAWALSLAARQGRPTAVVVSHSFELLTRDRTAVSRLHARRFERFCEIAACRGASSTTGFAECDDLADSGRNTHPLMQSSVLRTMRRMSEQAVATLAN